MRTTDTIRTRPNHPGRSPQRTIITVGQLSVDTTIMLDQALTVGDQTTGSMSTNLGGTAAIVAHNAACLGADVTFAGHTGTAGPDLFVLAELSAAGVRIGPLTQTAVGLRVVCAVDPDGTRTMLSTGAPPVWNSLVLDLDESSLVYFEGWPLFARDEAYIELIHRAAAHGASVVVDVCSASRARSPREHARLIRSLPITVLLANDLEADRLGLAVEPAAPVQLIHRGANSTALTVNGNTSEISVRPVEPIDTTGAGDTFAAGLLAGMAHGHEVSEAVDLAHRAAARVVLQRGPLLTARHVVPSMPHQLQEVLHHVNV